MCSVFSVGMWVVNVGYRYLLNRLWLMVFSGVLLMLLLCGGLLVRMSVFLVWN